LLGAFYGGPVWAAHRDVANGTMVTQIGDARAAIASTLRIDPQRSRIIAAYVGGGFGSKLRIHSVAGVSRHAREAAGRVAARAGVIVLCGSSITSPDQRAGSAVMVGAVARFPSCRCCTD